MAPKSSEQFEEIRERSKQNIMDSARKLFAEKGYDATSISAITREAGISKGLLYNYFNSKEELLLGILNEAMEIGNEMAALLFQAEKPEDKIRLIIEQGFKWITEHEDYSKTLMALSIQVGKLPQIQQMVDGKIEGYRQLFTQLFADLGFENPEMEAYCLGALFDGIGLQYISVGDKIGMEKVKAFLLEKYCKNQSNS